MGRRRGRAVLSARDIEAEARALAAAVVRDAKARTWVEPHVRDGDQVAGHYRNSRRGDNDAQARAHLESRMAAIEPDQVSAYLGAAEPQKRLSDYSLVAQADAARLARMEGDSESEFYRWAYIRGAEKFRNRLEWERMKEEIPEERRAGWMASMSDRGEIPFGVHTFPIASERYAMDRILAHLKSTGSA